MSFALGSHRFNPQTGLWELVSPENATGFEMSLPMVAEVAADGVAVGPVTALPEPVVAPPSEDAVFPHGFRPPTGDALTVIEVWVNSRTGERFYAGSTYWTNDDPDWVNMSTPFGTPLPSDGQSIIGGPIHSLLTGGDGNDLVIAGASADHEENWGVRLCVWFDPTDAWPIFETYLQQGMHGSLDADRHNSNGPLGDTLNGGLGRDTLIGNDLSNDMNGGAGADVMIGGGGADIYWVDDAGDMVMEYDHGGRDVVYSSVSYTLSAHVEKLVLALRAGDINGTGNELDNILIGNLGRNVLSGGAGDDWLNGASGGDTLIGGDGEDVFAFGRSPFSSTLEASTILDFEVGVDKIVIDLPNTFNFEDPWPGWLTAPQQLPAMRQEGADTIITLTVDANAVAQEIRLVGVDMHLLSEVDFGFNW